MSVSKKLYLEKVYATALEINVEVLFYISFLCIITENNSMYHHIWKWHLDFGEHDFTVIRSAHVNLQNIKDISSSFYLKVEKVDNKTKYAHN